MDQLAKNEKIKQAILATRRKHANMTCKTYEVKIDKSHLSKTKSGFLKSIFREAKWLYNHILSVGDVFAATGNLKEVTVLNKDREPEVRPLSNLSSHMAQEIVTRTKNNVVALGRLKAAGNRIGKLKYKSQVNSIPLKQYGNTYKVKGNTIKIQGCKKPFRVMGLKQLPPGADLTNATLVRRTGDYYIKITCFVDKVARPVTGRSVGLDFGIKDSVTTSDGEKFNFSFPESKQLKKASRKVHKSVKGSKSRYKKRLRLQKEYRKQDSRKQDARNKFIN